MRIIAVSTALLVLATSSLSAQRLVENRNAREGFWIGLGVGAGSAGLDFACCRSTRSTGPSGYVRLGGTVSQNVLIGGETGGWTYSENGATYMIGAASAVVLWYPDRTGAFYLKVGLGALHYGASDHWRPSVPVAVVDVFFPFYGEAEVHALAAYGSFGLGYEFRVGRNTSINAFLNGLASTAAKLEVSDVSQPSSQNIKVNLVQVGVGLTWH